METPCINYCFLCIITVNWGCVGCSPPPPRSPCFTLPHSVSGLVNLQLLPVIRPPRWAGTLQMDIHWTSITHVHKTITGETHGRRFEKISVILSLPPVSAQPGSINLTSTDVYRNESHSPQKNHNQIKPELLSTIVLFLIWSCCLLTMKDLEAKIVHPLFWRIGRFWCFLKQVPLFFSSFHLLHFPFKKKTHWWQPVPVTWL